MAKAKKGVSLHSRAARRSAGTPPPKDIAAIPRPASPDDQKKRINSAIERNAYGVSPGSGVSKRKKVLSAKQKRRKEQAMEKAEAALEKLATKVEESVKRGTVVQKRRINWDVLNEEAEIEVGKMEVELKEGRAPIKPIGE